MKLGANQVRGTNYNPLVKTESSELTKFKIFLSKYQIEFCSALLLGSQTIQREFPHVLTH